MRYSSYSMVTDELFAFAIPKSDDSRSQLLALLNAKGAELTWQHARELFWEAFSVERPAEAHIP